MLRWAAGVAVPLVVLVFGLVLSDRMLVRLPVRRVGEYVLILGCAFWLGGTLVRMKREVDLVDWLSRAMPRRPAWRMVLLMVVQGGFIALLFGPAVRFELLADDYLQITYAVGFGPQRWLPQPNWHHYFPLGLELLALPHRFAGWNPAWFHVHGLIAMWLTSCAVMALAYHWGIPAWFTPWAGLVWLAFPLQASAGFWVSIVLFTYCALFGVLALLAFQRYVRSGSWWGIMGATLATAASMLCVEQGAAVALLCGLAAWMNRASLRDRSRLSLAAAVLLPVGVVAAILAWKSLAGGTAAYPGMGLTAAARTAAVYGWSLLTPGWSTGLQVGLVFANRGTMVLMGGLACAAGLYRLAMRGGSPARKFGVLWALVAGLPVVAGAPGVVSRYYPLPAVGVALALAAWLSEARDDQTRLLRRVGVLVVLVGAGTIWIGLWRPDFAQASSMTTQLRADLAELLPGDVPYERIALVDLPSHVGDGDWPATVFATGPRVMIGLSRDDYDLEAVRAVRIWRTGESGWLESEAVPVSEAELAAAVADPMQVVLWWDSAAGGLVRLGAGRLDEVLEGG